MKKSEPLLFQAAIPGQSLTDEPRNYPWENPPKLNDPDDVIDYYVEKLTKEEVADNVLGMLDLGLPIDVLSDAMLSTGIMEGIHTVDVKLLIKNDIMAAVKGLADEAEIDYKLYASDYDDKDAIAERRRMKRIAAKIAIKKSMGQRDEGDTLQAEVAETLIKEPTPEAEEQRVSKGLMAKEQDNG